MAARLAWVEMVHGIGCDQPKGACTINCRTKVVREVDEHDMMISSKGAIAPLVKI